MKSKIIIILSKPKVVIPIATILCIVLGIIIYPMVGNAPTSDVSIPKADSVAAPTSGSALDLSFTKSGRVESVFFKTGDSVRKGAIIATLSAPDAKGTISQAKGALALAEAQYASLNLDYSNLKKQQDAIVDNAYQALLKTTPEALAKDTPENNFTTNFSAPVISGNYLLGKEGIITIETYSAEGGMAFHASGLVDVTSIIKESPTSLGDSGLFISFPHDIPSNLTWTITIPNINSRNYAANKAAYDLAVINRDKALSELAQNIGSEGGTTSVAKAAVDAARGSYEAALGAYQGFVITAPADGIINFIDENLKPGQVIAANKTVVSITAK